MHPHNMHVVLDGNMRVLTERQTALLFHLAHQYGKLCTRESLLRFLYPDGKRAGGKILDVMVFQLRRRLRLPENYLIHSVWGRGYYFCEQELSQNTKDTLPLHTIINVKGLPRPDKEFRWTPRSRRILLRALNNGRMNIEDVETLYGISKEEIDEWYVWDVRTRRF